MADTTFENAPAPQAANDNSFNVAYALTAALEEKLNEKQVKEIVDVAISEWAQSTQKIELVVEGKIEPLPEKNRHYLFEDVLKAVHCNIPAALIGPAGSGKSTLCEQIAEALKLPFYLQNSVGGPHELAGYMDAHGKYQTTPFRTAYQEGGLLLIDEVDTSDPTGLKWINTALANGHAVFPDTKEPIKRHNNFRMIIAANTYGTGADRVYVGANQMDASTLDRFVFFDFGYDEKLEARLAGNPKWVNRVQKLRKAAMSEHARIVISPRASIHGAKLLANGWSQQIVEQRLIWKGIDQDLKNRISKKAA